MLMFINAWFALWHSGIMMISNLDQESYLTLRLKLWLVLEWVAVDK